MTLLLGNIQKLGCAFGKCFFSVDARILAQYSPKYVDPNPDPEFYRNNPPNPQDEIALKPVKAASTSQTYSTFYDENVLKFEKMLLKKGKSSTARRIMRDTFEYIKLVQVKKYHKAALEDRDSIELDPFVIFGQALENSKPLLSVNKVKKGKRVYLVPIVMPVKKQFFFVSKAMCTHIRSGKPKTDASERLGKEILAAYHNEGFAVKAKQDLHKQAYTNRAYTNLTG